MSVNVNNLIFVIKKDPKKGDEVKAMPCLKDKKAWAAENGYRVLEGIEAEKARDEYMTAQGAPAKPEPVKPETAPTDPPAGGEKPADTPGDDDEPQQASTSAGAVKPEKTAKK